MTDTSWTVSSLVALAYRRFLSNLHVRASTRPAGVLRIVLTSLAMSKWAAKMTMDRMQGPWWQMGFGLVALVSFLFLLLGFRTRLASVVAAACAFYIAIGGLNIQLGWAKIWSHHEACLAIAMVILALLPSGGSYSVDRWLAVRRAEREGVTPPREEGPMWAWPLLAFHVSVIYFYGGVVKCHWGYLHGDRLEQILMTKYLGSVVPREPWFRALMVLSAVGSVILEFSLSIGLWIRRFRWPLVWMGVIFHAFMYATLTVFTFSMTMCILYMGYFAPNDIHRELERLHGPVGPQAGGV